MESPTKKWNVDGFVRAVRKKTVKVRRSREKIVDQC